MTDDRSGNLYVILAYAHPVLIYNVGLYRRKARLFFVIQNGLGVFMNWIHNFHHVLSNN